MSTSIYCRICFRRDAGSPSFAGKAAGISAGHGSTLRPRSPAKSKRDPRRTRPSERRPLLFSFSPPQRAVKGRALDRSPSRRRLAFAMFSGRRSEDRSRLSANRTYVMSETKLTFAERVELMQEVVRCLRNTLDIIEDEADAMAEAAKRFAAKKPTKSARKS